MPLRAWMRGLKVNLLPNDYAEVLEWTRRSGATTREAWWKKCRRADWMMGAAAEVASTLEARRDLVLAACACVRRDLIRFEAKYPQDKRPRTILETAESWARGGKEAPSEEDVLAVVYPRPSGLRARNKLMQDPIARWVYGAARNAAETVLDPWAAYSAVGGGPYAVLSDQYRKAMAERADLIRLHHPKAPGRGPR